MSTLTIVASFVAMLFLPCAVALFAMKEKSEPEPKVAKKSVPSLAKAKKAIASGLKAAAAEVSAPAVSVEKQIAVPEAKAEVVKAEPVKLEQPAPAQTMPVMGTGSVAAARAAVTASRPQGTIVSNPGKALSHSGSPSSNPGTAMSAREDWAEPVSPRRQLTSHQARVERAEIEALKARALAVRAHAEALAAVARAASAKADAAQYEAAELEVAASMMGQDAGRRAA